MRRRADEGGAGLTDIVEGQGWGPAVDSPRTGVSSSLDGAARPVRADFARRQTTTGSTPGTRPPVGVDLQSRLGIIWPGWGRAQASGRPAPVGRSN